MTFPASDPDCPAVGGGIGSGLTLVRPQRFATYMVISMPKRSSVAFGVSHFISMSFHAGSD
jgi:hypothetical protein